MCILPYLCVMQCFRMLYMSKDIAKLLHLSQKVVLWLTYGIRRRSEKLSRRNQRDRDRRGAESAQQREARLARWRVKKWNPSCFVSVEGLACETLSNNPHWAGSRARKEEMSLGTKLWKSGDNRDYITKGLTPYSIAERILIPQLYVLSKYPL